ncbi:putativepod-specific dehydrogenase SAC25 [Papiliotrema laurentii]|uniref:Putativepod-specific dehydrogenase SAC25 n=1 Tax=Papiliotrema laurentii TaxID=5418 RepID=A0AAD9D2R1_PAPLA|nr:putativepod-specific dehydrogenase SAC25 [Papiliotrema laurentii]
MSLGAYLAHRWNVILHSGFPIFFWVKPHWTVDEIPDQSGKVVVVTGGNSGTGYATCKALYEAGATVYLCCRDLTKGEKAVSDIKKGGVYGAAGLTYPESAPARKGSGSVQCLELDLADLNSVARFAEDFKRREKRLDLLFANAGVMASPEGLFTKQGYTLQFGTNTLGHQRLIAHLLPLLLQTARDHPESLPRVLSVSSAGHTAAPPGGFDAKSVVRDPSLSTDAGADGKPQRGPNEHQKWVEYGQSKWGNVAIVRYLHWLYGPDAGRPKHDVKGEREGEGEIISIALHPGIVATNLAQHMTISAYLLKINWIAALFSKTADIGASNQLWAATVPEAEARKLSGEYIVPFQSVGVARPDLDDPARVQEMWDWCELQGKRFE